MKSKSEAIIYPILPEHADRLFKGKDVFCKYVGERLPSITVGAKFILYLSGGSKQLVGEAKINDIKLMTVDEILKEFADRLFISADELERYRDNRPKEKKLLVLLLSGIKKFSAPLTSPKVVTMAGCTLTKNEYKKLIKLMPPRH
ncbi:MAG: DUF365 domain-containing protein [Thermoplasmatales archaeon]